jgi:hypothetical protein
MPVQDAFFPGVQKALQKHNIKIKKLAPFSGASFGTE